MSKWCGGGGHSAWLLLAHSLPCHSRAGGNRAWVVISYLIGGNNSALCFYYYKAHDTNFIDPIPALSTPQIH